MKHHITLFLAAFLACIGLRAQNKQLLYDFSEIPQALIVNPGVEVDYKWYAGIPATNISFQAGLSGVDVNDIFDYDDNVDGTMLFQH